MKKYKLEKVQKAFDARARGDEGSAPCICVHGKKGAGKTALLGAFADYALKNGANVYLAVSNSDDGGTGSKAATRRRAALIKNEALAGSSAIRELLRQLMRMYGSDRDLGFARFVDSYIKGTLADEKPEDGAVTYDKDALVKFIYDCVKTEPLVFVIDDLDKADMFTINLIGRLIRINALQFLVFSHTDKLDSPALTDMLYANTAHIEYVELRDESERERIKDPLGLIIPFDADPDAPTQSSEPSSVATEQDIAAAEAPPALLPDEATLILTRPGNERQLAKHHMNDAQQFMKQLAFDKAIESMNTALDICRTLKENPQEALTPEDALMEIDFLICLGDAQMREKLPEQAASAYRQAQYVTDVFAYWPGLPDTAANNEILEKRIALSLKLAECLTRMNMPDRAREQVMLAEAFFCAPENRAAHTGLYAQHIASLLYLLAELDEKVIFREKLKQAYAVCGPDDMDFTGALYCEEAIMLMETDALLDARNLLDDARKIAEMQGSAKLWDEATNALALCCEQLEQTSESEALWRELIDKSYDPAKVAVAMMNIAFMNFRLDEDTDKASAGIKAGIDLCILAGEEHIVDGMRENLKDSPLAESMG